jgi:hypothetical protein
VCNGESTEPAYFRGLKEYLRNPAVQIKVKIRIRAPEELVRYARSIAPKGGDEFDEVWCVMDADEYDLAPAVILATELNVKLAVSNPCFELWLLLHHRDYSAPLCDARAALRQLKRRLPQYRKNDLRFEDFESGVLDALRRAASLDPTGSNYGCDPSSGVWKLVQLMTDDT